MSRSTDDNEASVRVARLGSAETPLPLEQRGNYDVVRFDSLSSLLESGRTQQPRVCILEPECDDRRPQVAAEMVRAIRRELPLTDVVVWAPQAEAELVRTVLLAGARDVLVWNAPGRVDERVRKIVADQTLLPRLFEENRKSGTWHFEDLISRSQKMWDIFETCVRTAATEASVLILGETGTGKELIARAIHRRSGRSGRFVPLNCGAVPATLIDSELFGHVEGAFTGARKSKDGLFRHAEGGTIFLDEIGNIPLNAQNSLLRTLQEGVVRPVGGLEEVPIDVRIIAATSAPLEAEIEAQRFREDLFYRLDVIRLILPPLRERPEDVIFLLGRFTHQLSEDYFVRRPEIGGEFLNCVCDYDWPGNVRELENFVERLVLTHPGERLTADHFHGLMRTYMGREEAALNERGSRSKQSSPDKLRVPDISRPLSELLEEMTGDFERRYIEEALRRTGGRVGEAATIAGIHRRTLLRKTREYDIDKSAFRDD
jgi:DNA-binding NtrC family response regulator